MSKTVEEILHKLNANAQEERTSCTARGNWEGYNSRYAKFEAEAIESINRLLIEAKQEAVKPYWGLEFAVGEAVNDGVFMPLVEQAYEKLQQTLKDNKL